jgi:hypothetical protein
MTARRATHWHDTTTRKEIMGATVDTHIGRAVTLEDRPQGLFATFLVARTPEGDDALTLAEDGVYDGLSIRLTEPALFSEIAGVWHSQRGNLLVDISLTPQPHFDSARVLAVDGQRRTITGLAMPYGVPAVVNRRRYQFSQGSLAWADPSRVKLLIPRARLRAAGIGE